MTKKSQFLPLAPVILLSFISLIHMLNSLLLFLLEIHCYASRWLSFQVLNWSVKTMSQTESHSGSFITHLHWYTQEAKRKGTCSCDVPHLP